MCFAVFRADPVPSPKVHASSGSFGQPRPLKRPLLSTLQKPNACISPLTNGHTADPKSPKSSGNLGSWKEEPDLSSTTALQFNQSKKRRRKKKRRHAEKQEDAEPLAPASAEPQVDSGNDQRRKKRKKKRKRENAEENMTERGCVPSHLDASNQEEDWCHGGIWSLTLRSDTEQPGPKSHLAARTEPQSDSEKVKKRKKKKKKMEALLDTSARSASETWVYTLLSVFLHLYTHSPSPHSLKSNLFLPRFIASVSDFNKVLHLFRVPEMKAPADQSDTAVLKKKLKKKKRRLKEEESGQCSDGHNGDAATGAPSSKKNATGNGKESKRGTGAREQRWRLELD